MSESKKPDYTIDCVEGGLRNLNALINVICEIRFGLSVGEDDARVDRLLWVARDLAEGLVDCHEREVRECAKRARA
jgi:hypothetical protein